MYKRKLSLALLVLFVCQVAYAIPQKINFQGRLVKDEEPVEGNVTLKFRFYDAETSGNQLGSSWEETQNNIYMDNGLFSAVIGSVTAVSPEIFTSTDNVWLEIELSTSPTVAPFPRQQINSVGFAFNAGKLDGVDASEFVLLNATQTFTGTNTFNNSIYLSSISANNADYGYVDGTVYVNAGLLKTKYDIQVPENRWIYFDEERETGIKKYRTDVGTWPRWLEFSVSSWTYLTVGHSEGEKKVTTGASCILVSENIRAGAFKLSYSTDSYDGMVLISDQYGNANWNNPDDLNFNADELDGLDSSDFVQIAATQTFTGQNMFMKSVLISSTVKIMDGTQAAGKVLTSDTNGLATWQAASGGDVYLASTQTFTGSNTLSSTTVSELNLSGTKVSMKIVGNDFFFNLGENDAFFNGNAQFDDDVHIGGTLGVGGEIEMSSGGGITDLGATNMAGNLAIGSEYISSDGDSEGLSIDNSGNVTASANMTATAFYGDGSNLTGLSAGDAYLASTQTFTGQNTFTEVQINDELVGSGHLNIKANFPNNMYLDYGNTMEFKRDGSTKLLFGNNDELEFTDMSLDMSNHKIENIDWANSDTAELALLASTQTFTGENTFSNSGNIYYGDGSNLTGLSSGDVYLASTQTFTGTNIFNSIAGDTMYLNIDSTDGVFPSGISDRIMWIPDKRAFRAGAANVGTEWDAENIGNFSVAFGAGNTAGYLGSAFGQNTIASGSRSFSAGNATKATGAEAFAAGNSSISQGENTTSFGTASQAIGDFSFVQGYDCVASGQWATAMGRKSSATATGSFVISDAQDSQFVVDTQNGFGARFAGGYQFTGGEVTISTSLVVNVNGAQEEGAAISFIDFEGSPITLVDNTGEWQRGLEYGYINIGNNLAIGNDEQLTVNGTTGELKASNIDWTNSDTTFSYIIVQGSGTVDGDLKVKEDFIAAGNAYLGNTEVGYLTFTDEVNCNGETIVDMGNTNWNTNADIAIGSNYISNDGEDEGISIDSSGNVTASGNLTASAFYGDGSNLTGVSSDSYLRMSLVDGLGVSHVYNSSDTSKSYGTWFEVSGSSGTIERFAVAVASTTTDAFTIRIWNNGSSETTLSMPAGVNYKQFNTSIDCDISTVIGVDFEDVSTDPVGGVSVVAILKED